jgi:hypothetical protein
MLLRSCGLRHEKTYLEVDIALPLTLMRGFRSNRVPALQASLPTPTSESVLLHRKKLERKRLVLAQSRQEVLKSVPRELGYLRVMAKKYASLILAEAEDFEEQVPRAFEKIRCAIGGHKRVVFTGYDSDGERTIACRCGKWDDTMFSL